VAALRGELGTRRTHGSGADHTDKVRQEPRRCVRCGTRLSGAPLTGTQRRHGIDLCEAAPAGPRLGCTIWQQCRRKARLGTTVVACHRRKTMSSGLEFAEVASARQGEDCSVLA
jgi:hypothetical protein